ncbi:D-threo-aldose 1-dehydrogenase (plasmid) [Azospirillum sp. B510]|uniref:aldo/keto reductase n=1 Tax=Azospirillum sp. (strain B510) TaxID=137722 RepID=UPI0001C4B8F9|nr:aldo/keto reductase [Azospirillum sp. B510]BAI74167.1 D-threo-aldose 1-dehydrogenase [Azospirillum sp. B510]
MTLTAPLPASLPDHLADRRILPRSGLSLPAIGLGCAQLGGLYRPTDPAEADGLLAAAWDAGIRYFDTAPYYGYGRSERRLGAALCDRPRDGFMLSTKVGRLIRPNTGGARVRGVDGDGWADPPPFHPVYDYSRDGILRSVEDSLQRLGLARIDILYVHDIGRVTHGDGHAHHWQALTRGGGFRALEKLRRDGAVPAIGLGVNEWEVALEAMDEVDLDCVMLAGRYTLLEQTSLSPFLERCLAAGTRIAAAGVFNSGILAGNGKFNYADAPPETIGRVEALAAACREFDVELPAAALQFPLAHPAVASCVTGVRNARQLTTNLAWLRARVPAAFWQALKARGLLDEAAPVPVGR